MHRLMWIGVVGAAACLGAAAGALAGRCDKVQASEDALPAELFKTGNRVNGLDATYVIEEVRGGWIRVRLFRSLDKHKAGNLEPRWIYVPAADTLWSQAAYDAPPPAGR